MRQRSINATAIIAALVLMAFLMLCALSLASNAGPRLERQPLESRTELKGTAIPQRDAPLSASRTVLPLRAHGNACLLYTSDAADE